jgi:hypothetical protein
MPDRIEQAPCVGHFGQRAVEVRGLGKPLPELSPAVLRDILLRARAEKLAGRKVEIREDSVGVQEQSSLGHQKRAGSSSTGIAASSG